MSFTVKWDEQTQNWRAWNKQFSCRESDVKSESPTKASYDGVVWVNGIPHTKDGGEFWGESDRREPGVLYGAMWWA